nr:hypothetical protein [Lachnospiraceae bacterium]
MEIGDIIIIGFSILYTIFLYSFSKGRMVKVERRLYFLFCVPLLAAALHIAKTDIDICLLGLYIGAFLPAICFFFEDVRWHKRLCIAAAFCTGLTVIPCIFYSGYRNPLYSEEFKEGVQMMRKYYVLSEYKGIDWDSLYDKYLVLFQEADTAKDLNAAFEAWQNFTMEFNDAHVSSYLTDGDDNHRRKYMQKHIGYDYGFCMVTLEDGRTVFANVDKDGEAYAVGIRDGMTVLSFDSKDIDTLKQDGDMWFSVFPDKENEAFFQSLAVTSSGAENVKVVYLDKSGREQTVELSGQGSNYERFRKTINQMLGFMEQTNLSYKMVNEDTACLVINDMSLDPMVRYASAFETDEDEKYGGLKAKMKDQVKKMKEEGAKNLIIDLRSNPGGHLEMSMALASLFIDKKYFAAAEGTYG